MELAEFNKKRPGFQFGVIQEYQISCIKYHEIQPATLLIWNSACDFMK